MASSKSRLAWLRHIADVKTSFLRDSLNEILNPAWIPIPYPLRSQFSALAEGHNYLQANTYRNIVSALVVSHFRFVKTSADFQIRGSLEYRAFQALSTVFDPILVCPRMELMAHLKEQTYPPSSEISPIELVYVCTSQRDLGAILEDVAKRIGWVSWLTLVVDFDTLRRYPESLSSINFDELATVADELCKKWITEVSAKKNLKGVYTGNFKKMIANDLGNWIAPLWPGIFLAPTLALLHYPTFFTESLSYASPVR